MKNSKVWRTWLENWAQQSHLYFELKMAVIPSILKLQKIFIDVFSPKNYFSWGVPHKFLFSEELFLNFRQKHEIVFVFYPLSCQIVVNSDSLGSRTWTQYNIFDDNSKMVHLRAKTCKTHPDRNNFLVKKIVKFFCSCKFERVTAEFKIQMATVHLIFKPGPSNFGN